MLEWGFIALGGAIIIAVVVWVLLYIEYKKIKLQEKIEQIRQRIRDGAEDSGKEIDGDAEWLAILLSPDELDTWDTWV
uniref:Protein Vpu n=1 Tax=Human immunodeficiency virus type 1 TaxID=11676 RepID=A0A2R2XFH3_HV1|nr:vpu protein [Human immunodeficiency virus 1]